MAQIIAFPFGLTPAGTVAVAEQGSDEANAEQIAVLALTRRGERQMVAGFGVRDPTFGRLDPGELAAAVAAWGPSGVAIKSVNITPTPDGHNSNVEVTFA